MACLLYPYQLRNNRLIGAVLCLACLAPLLVGAWLTPAPSGLGTHTELGLAPCGFHLVTGLPCATCGMTTSLTHAAHGHLLTALYIQPAGAVFALLCAVMCLVAGWSAISGMSLQPIGAILGRPLAFLIMLAVVLGAWGYTLCMHLGDGRIGQL
ncbi:MAG: DUF2752 domain-containing protein [Phycisphaeraceae bacterium]|nr:DUF2752 domain-containing protein [Phycisphaeraceae bacterium]